MKFLFFICICIACIGTFIFYSIDDLKVYASNKDVNNLTITNVVYELRVSNLVYNNEDKNNSVLNSVYYPITVSSEQYALAVGSSVYEEKGIFKQNKTTSNIIFDKRKIISMLDCATIINSIMKSKEGGISDRIADIDGDGDVDDVDLSYTKSKYSKKR